MVHFFSRLHRHAGAQRRDLAPAGTQAPARSAPAAAAREAIELPARRGDAAPAAATEAPTHRFSAHGTLDRLRGLRERGAQAVYDHGFGAHQTTAAIHPLRTTVSSAEPRLGSAVRGEGMPAPHVPDAIADATPAPSKGPAPETLLYGPGGAPGEAMSARDAQALVSAIVDRHFRFSTPAHRRELTAAICGAGTASGLAQDGMRQLAQSLAARHGHASDASAALETVVDRHRMLAALEAPNAAADTVERHFRASPAGHRAALTTAIDRAAAASRLSPAETALLADQLATSFTHASEATRALNGLADVRLLGDIASPRPASAAGRLAWKFAADMESTDGVGLDLLDKLTDRAPAGSAQPQSRPPLDIDQRGAVRAYLRAATEVQRAGGRLAPAAPDPDSMFRHGNLSAAIAAARRDDPQAWPGRAGAPTPPGVRLTLAEKALLAVHDQLDPDIHAVHGCRFAVEMARGGMVTDAPRNPDGSKSEFFMVESRASKTLGLHLDRAIGLHGRQRVKEAITRPLLHQGKSPFFANDTVLAGRHAQARFALAHHGATNEGRLIADDMFGLVGEALQRTGGAHGAPLPTAANPRPAAALAGEPETLRGLLRVALMQEMKTDPVFLPRLAAAPEIPPHVMDSATAKVLGAVAFDPADAAGNARLEEALAGVVAEHTGARLTPQRLRDWAADAGAPWTHDADPRAGLHAPAGDGAAAPPGALRREEWAPFAQAYARLAQGERSSVTARPIKGSTRPEVAQMLEEMINGLELIGGFSFSNAGNTNGTTKNVSEVVSGILAAGAGALRIDLGGGLVREVMFEAGTATDRMALRMSVATLKRVQAGAGGSAGLHVGETSLASASVAVGADAGYAYELVRQEGASFGFPRHRSGGVNGDKALYAKMGKLARLLIEGDAPGEHFKLPGNPEDRGSLVKRAYQEFGAEISVGRFSVEQSDHKTTVGVSGGPAVTAGHFKLSMLPTSVAKQWRRGEYVYEDHSGSLQVRKEMQPRTSKITVGGSLAGLNGLIDTMAPTHVAGHTLGVTTQLGAGAIANAAMDIQAKGTTASTVHVKYDGKTVPTTFATTTFARAKEWNEDLGANLERYAEDKARKFRPARYAADPAGTVADEMRYLSEYAGRVGAERDVTTTFQKYDEFPGHTGQMDLLGAKAHLAARRGEADEAARAARGVHGMFDDPDCRQYRFAVAIHTQSNSVMHGPAGLMGLTHAMVDTATQKAGDFT